MFFVLIYFTALERKFDKLYSKAELGSSIVLNCPIESVPHANFLWNFNNESNINFDTSERYTLSTASSLLIPLDLSFIQTDFSNNPENLFADTLSSITEVY